jgi:hypothetical protein
MPIHPFRLDGISTDGSATLQSKTLRTELSLPSVNVAQDVFFTGTNGARTPFSQEIEEEIAFDSVTPTQSKLIANDSHVFQAELHWVYSSHCWERKQAGSQELGATSHIVHLPSVTSGRLLSSIRVLSPLKPPPTGDWPPAAH